MSVSFLAYVGNIAKFSSVKSPVAYAGLKPKVRESGVFKGKAHISKLGTGELRKALYMQHYLQPDAMLPSKKQWEKLVVRNKGGKVGICAVMRKLLKFAYGVLKSGLPFDTEIAFAMK